MRFVDVVDVESIGDAKINLYSSSQRMTWSLSLKMKSNLLADQFNNDPTSVSNPFHQSNMSKTEKQTNYKSLETRGK